MAGADAVRDVADTIAFLLRGGIPAATVDPTRIVVTTPDEFESLRSPAKPNITIFLYRIAVNAPMRNNPRRLGADGTVIPPVLPLELSFLVTAWAKDTRDELRLIGLILQVLNDRREIGAADIVGSTWEADDTLQLVLESLPLDDHYRIWNANEVPYRLSLTYTARVVGLSSAARLAFAPVVDASLPVTAP